MRHDHEKTAELYRSFGPRVYRRCLRLLGDEEAALDATQEVFLKLVVNMPRLQDREHILPWMLSVARNHCLNIRRAARQHAALTHALGQEEPHGGGDLSRALLARALLSRFDPSMQRVVLGVICDGLRHEDAAAALGISTAAVARKVQRFLSTSREHVTRSEYEEAGGANAVKASSRSRPRLGRASARTPPPAARGPAPARAAPAGASSLPFPDEALDPAA